MKRTRTSPYLSRETVARSRQLRREMTPAERALRAGIRKAFPGLHFRTQVPMGPYYADFACHGARLILEVDGSSHVDNEAYDAARTAFLNGEGYQVLRFWNNEVLRNLEGVLTLIAAHLPSPLVGEGGPKGRMGGARRSRARAEGPPEARRRRARASGSHPLPNPPHKGEGFHGQPPVGDR